MKYKTLTAREIYKDKYICIRQRIVVDENEEVVDTYISARKVKDGKVVKHKAGIIQIENLTDNLGHHTDKLTNLFLSRNFGYLAGKVQKDENGVYTLGEPVLANDETMRALKTDGTPHENSEDKELKYANEITAYHGSLAQAITLLHADNVIDIARKEYYKEHHKLPCVLFPKNLGCHKAIMDEYNTSIALREAYKNSTARYANTVKSDDGRDGK